MKKNRKKQIALFLGVCLSTALYAQESIKLEAEKFAQKSERVTISERKTGETAIGEFVKGEWIKFENINLAGKTQVKIRAASGAKSNRANVEVRLNSVDGEVIGRMDVPIEGWGVFEEVKSKLPKKALKSGDVYIVSLTGGIVLDWVEFL